MATDNTLRIEDWETTILKRCPSGTWSLEPRNVILNEVTHVKGVYPSKQTPALPNSFCSNLPSYELVVKSPSSGLLIMDFDYANKSEQVGQFARRESRLVEYLRRNPSLFYWEETINKGLHVIMLVVGGAVVNEAQMVCTDEKRLEFKSSCLVAPSKGYKSSCNTTLVPVSQELAAGYFGELTELFFGETYNLASYVKLGGRAEKKRPAPKTASQQQRSSELDESADFDSFMSSQYGTSSDYQLDTEPTVVMAAPAAARAPAKKRQRGKRTTVDEEGATEPAPPPKRARKGAAKDGGLLDRCERRLGQFYAAAQGGGSEEDEADEAAALSPVDALYLKLIESIADNAEVTCMGITIARDIVYAIFETLRPFVKFIKLQEEQKEIDLFPINVQIFLEILLCSDVYMEKDVYKRFHQKRATDANTDKNLRASFSPNFYSIFSRLGSTPHWLDWTKAYQRLFDKIQGNLLLFFFVRARSAPLCALAALLLCV